MRFWKNFLIVLFAFAFLILGRFVLASTTTTWDFSTAADYVYDANLIDISGNTGSLKLLDQTDDDNTATGFASGTNSNTQWVAASSSIQLDTTGKTNGTGTFTSRIMDAGTSTSWTTLTPTTVGPYGKPLPNSGGIETVYTSENASMSGNLLLFHFDESSGDLSDSSGNSKTGTASGTLAYNQTGIFNGALNLDGTSGRVIVPNFDGTAGATTMTIEGWFKFTTVAASDVLVAQYNSGVNQRFSWQTHTTVGELVFFAGSTPTGALNTWYTSGSNLVSNKWYHLALVFDASAGTEAGKIKMYVNGLKPTVSKSGSQTVTALTNTTGLALRLGDMENFDPREWPGTMDEVAVYSRALTDAEILSRYHRGNYNVKYQVRTCDDSACSGESLVGPSASTTDYYNELSNTTTSTSSYSLTGLTNNRYFQYSTLLTTVNTSTNDTPQISSMIVAPAHRYGGSPTIQAATTTAVGFAGALNSFLTTEGGTGSIGYQVTNQGTNANPTWYYWNGSAWTTVASSADQNTSSTINTNITSFTAQLGAGYFSWRAFLNAYNATETASVSSVAINYNGPTITSSDDPANTRSGNLIIDAAHFNTSTTKTVVDWRVGGASVAVLNMPFEAHASTATVAVDYSQNGFNGVVTGATFSSSTGRDGKGAYTFNGTTNYISVAHSSALALTNNFTVSAWVKRAANGGWDGFATKATYSANATTGWALEFDATTQRYAAMVACNGSIDTIPVDPGLTSTTDFGWHFMALKVASGTAYVYLDGVKQKYYSTQTICDTGGAISIGRFYSNLSAHYLEGLVDEVNIWNRVLTDNQIMALYNLQNDRIVAEEAQVGEVWSASVTQNNSTADIVTETSNSVTINARNNTTPVIVSTTPNPTYYWVRSGQTLAMNINSCTNEDGTTPLYSWTVDGNSVASTQSFNMVGSSYSVGQHTVVATCASNNGGGSDTKTFVIEVFDATDFTIVMPSNLGQTSKYYVDILRSQNQWVADLQSYLNTKFTSFIGDLVIDGSQASLWSNVSSTFGVLDRNSVPYAATIGNHDYDDNIDGTSNSFTRNANNFNTYLPQTRYSGNGWWGGAMDGTNINTYQYFTVDGIDYMVLNLEMCPSDTTLDWANSIVSANASKNVIVVTHAYLNTDGSLLTNQSLNCAATFGTSFVSGVDINDGQQMWDEFVKLHNNIFMVLSGHVLGGGSSHRQDTATYNNLVSQVFHYTFGDYTGSDEHNAVTGLFTIKPASNTIQMRDYDMWFDTMDTTTEHSYTMQLGVSSTPTNTTGIANSVSQITLNWGANSHPSTTQYYAENTTASTTSGWATSTSWAESGLTCGTTYSYRVKAKNTFGYIGDFSSPISVKTVPCVPVISTPSQTVNSANISIVGTAEADSTVTVSGGATTVTGTATGGNFTIVVSLTQNTTNTLLITATDSLGNTSATSSVVILEDSEAPSNPGQLVAGTISTTTLLVVFGVPSTGADFSQYKIFYKAGSSGVSESDTEINSSTDSNLGYVNYNSATSTTITGLNANIQYVTNIWAYDTLNNKVSSTAELAFYTAASVPTGTAVVITDLSAALSWSDNDATSYYAENTTLGTNSGWISANTWTSESLVCGTTYSFRVKAKNGNNAVTEFGDTVSASTAVCAVASTGGGVMIIPLKPSIKLWETTLNDRLQEINLFSINSGATKTSLRTVKLSFNVKDVATIALSNRADFSGASFEPYESTKDWVLTDGSGLKTVYVRFRSKEGGTLDASMNIHLTNSSKVVVPATKLTTNYFKTYIVYGSRGANVTKLQTILFSKGYLKKSDIVGIFGKKTLAAVKKFQKDNKIPTTGTIGPMTRAILNKLITNTSKVVVPATKLTTNYFKTNIVYGGRGANVTKLQTILFSKGYLKKSDIVGIFGKKTLAAVRKFQRDNLILATGNVGPQTRKKLNQILAQ